MPETPSWLKRINPRAVWRSGRRAIAGWKSKRSKKSKSIKPRTYKPIHLATLMMLTVIALAVTTVAAWFMWDAAQVPAKLITSPDLAVRAAQLRVDVIRNILAVGAGTGGLIALFLALRRQYVKERVDYDDQAHKNRTAKDTRYDATERRVTDLYVKAAEQLGSDKAAVRLAALYALERLGQDNPEHRQTIVNLLCAYLRMPFIPPKVTTDTSVTTDQVDEEEAKRLNEREVRVAAQQILRKHLRYERSEISGGNFAVFGGSNFWRDMDLDLTGAVLIDFDLHRCSAHILRMPSVRFVGNANFSQVVTQKFATFTRCVFLGMANFKDCTFLHGVILNHSVFAGIASFDRSVYGRLSSFMRVNFRGPATFRDVSPKFLVLNGVEGSMEREEHSCWPVGYELVRAKEGSKRGILLKVENAVTDNLPPSLPQPRTDRS